MDFIAQNLSESLIIAGIALLIIEVAILGFATFVLFFMGCSMVITGGLMLLGVLDATYISAFWSNAIVTGVLAALLWKPLKKSQQNSGKNKETATTIVHQFTLENDVDNQGLTHHQYSGIQWKVKSQQPLTKGTQVKVVKADVGALWVEQV
ncbi:NfeD family protein [Pseudomonas sp. HK3]|jgi:membrane protein implicated in regulation of membrane protease activity